MLRDVFLDLFLLAIVIVLSRVRSAALQRSGRRAASAGSRRSDCRRARETLPVERALHRAPSALDDRAERSAFCVVPQPDGVRSAVLAPVPTEAPDGHS